MLESRTLVISDICPGAELTAGIALEKFISQFKKSVYTFTICNPNFHSMLLSKLVPPKKSYWAIKPNESWEITNRFFSFFGDVLASLETNLLHKRIKEVIDKEEITHIIIVLQGQTMYRIFNLLNEKNLIITTVTWDSWDWWSFSNKVPNSVDKQVQGIQKSFIAKGFHLVPTLRMAHNLKLIHNNFQRFVMPSNEIDLLPKNDFNLKTGVVKIVFSGQSYALNETLKFIEIMKRLNWKISSLRVELHVIGSNAIPTGSNIFHHGWLDQRRLIKTLNKMTLAFLPYPLDGLPESVASESFPSKLSDYSYVGLPVVYIGPLNSEIVRSIDSFGVHLKTDYTLDQIALLLSGLIANLRTYGENSKSFYKEICSVDVFNKVVALTFSKEDVQFFQDKDNTSGVEKIRLNSTIDVSLKIYFSHLIRNFFRLISLFNNKLFIGWLSAQTIAIVRYLFIRFARLRLSMVLLKEKLRARELSL